MKSPVTNCGFSSSSAGFTAAPKAELPPAVKAVMKAAVNASAVIAAEPMAKPLPVAAVVLPKLSRASVRSRTSSGRVRHFGDTAGVISHRTISVSPPG